MCVFARVHVSVCVVMTCVFVCLQPSTLEVPFVYNGFADISEYTKEQFHVMLGMILDASSSKPESLIFQPKRRNSGFAAYRKENDMSYDAGQR